MRKKKYPATKKKSKRIHHLEDEMVLENIIAQEHNRQNLSSNREDSGIQNSSQSSSRYLPEYIANDLHESSWETDAPALQSSDESKAENPSSAVPTNQPTLNEPKNHYPVQSHQFIVHTQLHPESVTEEILAPQSVSSKHVQHKSIDSEHIADQSITPSKVAPHSIEENHLAKESVSAEHIRPQSVQSHHIDDSSINKEHIAPNAIQFHHLSADIHEKLEQDNKASGKVVGGTYPFRMRRGELSTNLFIPFVNDKKNNYILVGMSDQPDCIVSMSRRHVNGFRLTVKRHSAAEKVIGVIYWIATPSL